MKVFNYMKVLGAFTDGRQPIVLGKDAKDRQERKMLDAARELVERGWDRRWNWLIRRSEEHGEEFDLDAERKAFFPEEDADTVAMPLQYVLDFMVRKIAAIQNNTSIHATKEVAELREVFTEYLVQLYPKLENIEFSHVAWSERERQKPKVLIHGKDEGGDVCIRLEAASELCHKFLNAALALGLSSGQHFDLQVEAVDPAIARNARAGKKVAETGKFVNHNMVLTVRETACEHTGKPPQGTPFVQKYTIEQIKDLYDKVQNSLSAAA